MQILLDPNDFILSDDSDDDDDHQNESDSDYEDVNGTKIKIKTENTKIYAICPFPECTRQILRKNLEGHLQTHQLEFTFFCENCDEGFKTQRALLRHERRFEANGKKCKRGRKKSV